MVGTSDKAVIDYLDTLFLDETLPPVQHNNEWVDHDSIKVGSRLLPCTDVFSLMRLSNATTSELWEGFLYLLILGNRLPQGNVRSYVFMQSQVLYQKARDNTSER